MAVRLGPNPIAWSNDDMPELGGDTPLEICLAEARKAGFADIEKGNKFPTYPAALQAVLARYGLAFVSGWYGVELRRRTVEQEIEAMQPHLDLLRACGCEVMVFAETSGTVQDSRGVPVADRPVMGEDEWPVFLDRLGDWVAWVERRPPVRHRAPGLRRRGPGRRVPPLDDRINHVHAKDMRSDVLARVRAEQWSFLNSVVAGVFTVPDGGGVDFVPALRPVTEAGYAGWLIVAAEQDPARAHPLTYARKGRVALRAAATAAGFHVV